jgi:hypothetical protein
MKVRGEYVYFDNLGMPCVDCGAESCTDYIHYLNSNKWLRECNICNYRNYYFKKSDIEILL